MTTKQRQINQKSNNVLRKLYFENKTKQKLKCGQKVFDV